MSTDKILGLLLIVYSFLPFAVYHYEGPVEITAAYPGFMTAHGFFALIGGTLFLSLRRMAILRRIGAGWLLVTISFAMLAALLFLDPILGLYADDLLGFIHGVTGDYDLDGYTMLPLYVAITSVVLSLLLVTKDLFRHRRRD